MKPSQSRAGGRPDPASLLVTLGLVVVAAFGLRTISNSDFWLHLALGRWIANVGIPRFDSLSFATTGAPWVNVTWLYDLLVHTVWQAGGATLELLVHVGAAVLAFGLLLPVARRWAGYRGIGLALILSGWLLAPRFTVTPQLLALPIIAAFILVLSRPRRLWVLAVTLLPLQVLWTNLHPSFFLGPIMVLVFVAESWLRERRQDPSAGGQGLTMALSVLTPVLILVTLANPYGARLHAYVLKTSANLAFSFVQEWISPFSGSFRAAVHPKHLVTLALVLGAGGLIAEKRRLPVGVTTLAVLSAFLVVRSLRFIELFAVMGFPFFALSASAIGVYLREKLRPVLRGREGLPDATGAALTAVLGLATILYVASNHYFASCGSASTFGLGAEYDLFPNAAAQYVERADFPDRAVNLVMDGGFLLWKNPGRMIFVDHRANLYGIEFFRTLNRCLSAAEGRWAEIEEKWEPGAIILNGCVPGSGPALRGLLSSGRWAMAYFDGTSALLVRATSENQPLIEDEQMQRAGLELLQREKQRYALRLGRRISPGVSPRLVGAASLFMALGRFREAEEVLELLVRGAPTMASAWLDLGVAQAANGETDEALDTLRRACALAPRSFMAWAHLHEVSKAAGREDEADFALEHARRINERAVAAYLAEREAQRGGSKPLTPTADVD